MNFLLGGLVARFRVPSSRQSSPTAAITISVLSIVKHPSEVTIIVWDFIAEIRGVAAFWYWSRSSK